MAEGAKDKSYLIASFKNIEWGYIIETENGACNIPIQTAFHTGFKTYPLPLFLECFVNNNEATFEINSTIRFIDNEEFKIGEEVELINGKHYKIKGFETTNFGLEMAVVFDRTAPWYLDSIQKIPDISTRD